MKSSLPLAIFPSLSRNQSESGLQEQLDEEKLSLSRKITHQSLEHNKLELFVELCLPSLHLSIQLTLFWPTVFVSHTHTQT